MKPKKISLTKKLMNNLNLVEIITQSGFFDLPKDNTCKSPEHNPPSHMVIPQGKGYKHVCPKCGKITTVIPTQISY